LQFTLLISNIQFYLCSCAVELPVAMHWLAIVWEWERKK
jgi:hypothetical protein